jgi:hypothetical protein
MLAGSIHPPFRLNFLNPAHLYSSTTLLSSNNERASHLLLLAASKHFSFNKTILSTTGFYIKIRASDLPHFEQSQKITNCHSRKKEKKRKEPEKLINDKISNQEEMKEAGKQEDDDPCI